jgi:hypothetical protein
VIQELRVQRVEKAGIAIDKLIPYKQKQLKVRLKP